MTVTDKLRAANTGQRVIVPRGATRATFTVETSKVKRSTVVTLRAPTAPR